MFKKFFDDLDTEKIVEVVNLVWNNREKITLLIERLPELLRETGDGIESAGNSAVKASVLLTGDGGKSMGVGKLSEMAADALENCQDEIQLASKVMERLGSEIDEIKIPQVKPKYIDVLGAKVVGGLEFGENHLVDNAAARLKNGSDRLEVIGRDLKTVAVHLRDLGAALTEAGGDLNDVGIKLKESGNTLTSLLDVNLTK
jgi:hypothetical protein